MSAKQVGQKTWFVRRDLLAGWRGNFPKTNPRSGRGGAQAYTSDAEVTAGSVKIPQSGQDEDGEGWRKAEGLDPRQRTDF